MVRLLERQTGQSREDQKAALAKFKKLTRTGVEDRSYTVREVLKAYPKWAKSHLAESTWKRRKKTLESFSDSVSLALMADDLRAFHVQKWIDANSKKRMPVKGKGNASKRVATDEDISPTTAGDYVTLVKGVMKWAKGMGYVDANPIEDMPKPAPRICEFFIPVTSRKPAKTGPQILWEFIRQASII